MIKELAQKQELEDNTSRLFRVRGALQLIEAKLKDNARSLATGNPINITIPTQFCASSFDLAVIEDELNKQGFRVCQSSTGYPDNDASVRIRIP